MLLALFLEEVCFDISMLVSSLSIATLDGLRHFLSLLSSMIFMLVNNDLECNAGESGVCLVCWPHDYVITSLQIFIATA